MDVGRCETEIVISWWDKAPRQTRTKISVSINFRKCLLAQSCIQNPFVPFSLSHLDNENVTNEMNKRKKERLKGKRNGEIIFRLELKHFQFNGFWFVWIVLETPISIDYSWNMFYNIWKFVLWKHLYIFFLILIFWIFFAQLVIRFFSETMLDQQKGTPYNEL